MSKPNRYRITHQTNYQYTEPVAICQNQLRMMPHSISRRLSGVECHWVHATVEPEPDAIHEYTDYFGNRVLSFAIESLHRQLCVTVQSEASVHQIAIPTDRQSPPWEQVVKGVKSCADVRWLEAMEYVFDSPRIRRDDPFKLYARESFTENRPLVEAALDLTRRIHDDFSYDTTATDVHTTTEEAFALRAGVCQDFAHVQIACLRSVGLPACYVSGYLKTTPQPGQVRMVGADESHAWASVYAGDTLGWIDFDPTNACLSNTNHIPICVGRDYSDVSPMRGVVLGGGMTKLQVSVDVESLQPKF